MEKEGNLTRIARMIDEATEIMINFKEQKSLCSHLERARLELWEALVYYNPDEGERRNGNG